MRALAAGGNRGEALRAYEHLRSLLAEELGAAPSAESEQLFADLLGDADADGLPPPRVRIGANAGRILLLRDNAPFVGRRGELAELEAHLDRALTDGPRLVTVSGEPGTAEMSVTSAPVGSGAA